VARLVSVRLEHWRLASLVQRILKPVLRLAPLVMVFSEAQLSVLVSLVLVMLPWAARQADLQ